MNSGKQPTTGVKNNMKEIGEKVVDRLIGFKC